MKDWNSVFREIDNKKITQDIERRIWVKIDGMEASACFSKRYRAYLFNGILKGFCNND